MSFRLRAEERDILPYTSWDDCIWMSSPVLQFAGRDAQHIWSCPLSPVICHLTHSKFPCSELGMMFGAEGNVGIWRSGKKGQGDNRDHPRRWQGMLVVQHISGPRSHMHWVGVQGRALAVISFRSEGWKLGWLCDLADWKNTDMEGTGSERGPDLFKVTC